MTCSEIQTVKSEVCCRDSLKYLAEAEDLPLMPLGFDAADDLILKFRNLPLIMG